jgi:hypothetical protein
VQLVAPAFAEATLFRFGTILETTLAPAPEPNRGAPS